MIRDSRRNKDYFDKWIEFTQRRWIDGDKKQIFLLENDEGKAGCAHDLCRNATELCILRYSRGDKLADIQSSIQQAVEMLKLRHSILASVELEKSDREMHERLDLGTLYQNLTCLSFLTALNATKEAYSFVLNLIGHACEDALLDHIAVALGDTTRKIAPQSKYPKVYDPLVEVINSPEDKRPAKLKKYLEGWYKRMKPIYWHDNHEGGEGAYFGYWCFEAALVVMLYNIDDESFCDNPYYPVDLVRYFKDSQQRAG